MVDVTAHRRRQDELLVKLMALRGFKQNIAPAAELLARHIGDPQIERVIHEILHPPR